MDFKKEISKLIAHAIGQSEIEEVFTLLEEPPNKEMGDYALPCFRLAKTLRKNPAVIAQELCEQIDTPVYLDSIEAKAGYLNFFVNQEVMIHQVLNEVIEKKENYGRCTQGEGKTVLIEFSSPNIAKPLAIHHIRSTVIGNAIKNIYDFMGYHTVSLNHLGDYGTQFGQLIAAYLHWGEEQKLKQDPIRTLLDLYVRFHKALETCPELEQEGRDWFKRLEEGDTQAVKLWKLFRETSLEEFNRVYELLGINFDSFTGESFYSDKMDAVVKELNQKHLLLDSQGAKIVDLEPYGMPPALIMKSNGSTLYITRDLAAAIYRKQTYDFYKSIYVVGSQQILHFKQWFKILELMGHSYAKDCEHVAFGMVSAQEGTFATRKGRVIFLEDVLNKAIDKTTEIIEKKNPGLADIKQTARMVGVGAVVFQELSNNRIKDYVFSWEKTLSFEGETGPYVQYTYARACSVLERSKVVIDSEINYSLLKKNKEAIEVIRVIGSFESVLERSLSRLEPHHIVRYVLDLSQAFNTFYHNHPINVEEEALRKAHASIAYAAKITIKTALKILGMQAPEKM